jgi:protein-S-isoprenylcysteine O-methyltransferase Ste14
MLMLGESVFSLLVVDVPNENGDFFSTFYAGIGTVILLQILTFQSQPHDANFHALRRNKDAGIGWGYLITIYSFALVCLGAAFTFFLQDFSFEEEARRLAAVTASSDRESDRERSAHLFCGALAVAFASLDGMTLFHLGIKESMSRLKSREKTNIAGLVILGFRLAVIPFTATVSQWETEPAKLSMIGLVCVLVQLVLRKLGAIFLSHDQVYALDPERSGHKMHHDVPKRGVSAAAWPNVTQAQAEPSKAISESD